MVILTNLIVDLVLLSASLVFLFQPPKAINHWYGYRTKRSKLSKEHWDFANQYSSKLMFGITVFFVFIQWTLFFLIEQDEALLISLGFLGVGYIAIIPITESRLKKTFPQ